MKMPDHSMKILAIGPHPDDIEIGCGGTLAKYADQGHEIYMYVLTDGCMGGDKDVRKAEQEQSGKLLGVMQIFWGSYKDTSLHLDLELILNIEHIVISTQPDFIFINYHDDTHQDHRITTKASISASRHIRNVLFYETPTTQHFAPTVYVELGTKYLERKDELLRAHQSQIEQTNISNITIMDISHSTANFRGVQSKTNYAEAFQPLRMLINI